MSDLSRKPLEYESTRPSVTRGQVWVVALLLLIQIVMTAQSNYAPEFATWVKGLWAAHKEHVTHRALVQQQIVASQQRLSFSEPSDKIVWDEDPDRAAGLLAQSGYLPMKPGGDSNYSFLIDAIPPIAHIRMPNEFPRSIGPVLGIGYANSDSAIVFMHGRRALNGFERLVAVIICGNTELMRPSDVHSIGDSFAATIWKRQSFVAASFGPMGEDGDPEWTGPTATTLKLQAGDETPVTIHWVGAKVATQAGQMTVQWRDQLRVFAGQIDPSDTSHFTIAYELDGQSSVIDGWLLASGTVRLKPRAGRMVNAVWYPHAK
jgi:hypothetical protein